MVDNLLAQVAGYLARVAQNIMGNIGGFFGSLASYFSNMARQIFDWMTTLVVRVTNWIQEIFAGIYRFIAQLSDSITRSFAYMVDRIMTYINYALNGVYTIVNSVIAKISAGIDAFIAMTRSWIGSLVQWFQSVIGNVITYVRDLVTSIMAAVKAWIDSAMNAIRGIYDAILASINRGIQYLIGGAEALINTVAQRLADVKEAFKSSTMEFLQKLTELDTKSWERNKAMIEKIANPWLAIVPTEQIGGLMQEMQRMTQGRVGLPEYRQHIAGILTSLAKASPPLAAIFMLLTAYSSVNAAIGKLSDVYTKPIIQEIAAVAPYELLSPIDIAAAWRRGFVDEGRAVEVIKRQGYTVDDARVILRLADSAPDMMTTMSMMMRGIITHEEFSNSLRVNGLAPEWANRLHELGQIIPPVQDLITMAVREAFSPEIANRFGQYEGFPQEFATWAQKQGLSPEWARRYWAAHWSLPSPTQGFEMFQRRIISEQDLHLLLRALDIMPFWRDKLTQLAYNPLTRVDVRRMHQMGVISDQDVYNSYLDIGYSPENAALLQDFTIKLNKGSSPVDDEELGRLNRQTVLNFYKDGLIPKDRAQALLQEMGIPADAAILYLRAIDLNEQLELRKADADFVVEQAQAGLLSFEEAQDQLNNMGLEPVEVQRAVNKLVRLLASKTKLPTKAEGEKMMEAGIISEATYRDLLSRLGYASHWIDAYIRLNEEENRARARKKEA